MNRSPALKPLRWPWLWLAAWWGGIALVVVLSLVPAPVLPDVPEGGDKLEHFSSYCLLALVAVQLFATRKALLRAGGGLVLLGIALEIAQGVFTQTRQMDIRDALANSAGVLAGLATALTPWRDLLLRYARRR